MTVWRCPRYGCKAQGHKIISPEEATAAVEDHIARRHGPKQQRDWSDHEWDDTDHDIATLLAQRDYGDGTYTRKNVARELGLPQHEVQKRVETMVEAEVLRDCGWVGNGSGRSVKRMAYGKAWPEQWPNPRREEAEQDSRKWALEKEVESAAKQLLASALHDPAGTATQAKAYQSAVLRLREAFPIEAGAEAP